MELIIDILISTKNDRLFNLQNLFFNNDNVIYVIIHQISNVSINSKYIEFIDHNSKFYKIRYYPVHELGLSKSRKLAISKAQSDLCIIADDDIIYKENFYNTVLNSFEKFPQADIITFQAELSDLKLLKDYKNEAYWHNQRTIMKVTSFEIAFRRKKLLEKKLMFDENFGLGSKYPGGEENIFLLDALRKGLKILYIPSVIIIHPNLTSGSIYNETMVVGKGAMFARMFGYFAFAFDFLFAIKKYNEYKNKMKFMLFLKLILKGSIDYLKVK